MLIITCKFDDNIYLLTLCLPLPFLLPCVSSLDDVAVVLLLGVAAELVVGELLVVIAGTVQDCSLELQLLTDLEHHFLHLQSTPCNQLNKKFYRQHTFILSVPLNVCLIKIWWYLHVFHQLYIYVLHIIIYSYANDIKRMWIAYGQSPVTELLELLPLCNKVTGVEDGRAPSIESSWSK